MEYTAFMMAIIAVTEKVTEWLHTAQELKEVEDKGGHVPPELIDKARMARKAAEALMNAQP